MSILKSRFEKDIKIIIDEIGFYYDHETNEKILIKMIKSKLSDYNVLIRSANTYNGLNEKYAYFFTAYLKNTGEVLNKIYTIIFEQ